MAKLSKHTNKWEMVRILLGYHGTEEAFVSHNKTDIDQILVSLGSVPPEEKQRFHVASRAILLKYWNVDRKACTEYLAGKKPALDKMLLRRNTHGGNSNYTDMFDNAEKNISAWKS